MRFARDQLRQDLRDEMVAATKAVFAKEVGVRLLKICDNDLADHPGNLHSIESENCTWRRKACISAAQRCLISKLAACSALGLQPCIGLLCQSMTNAGSLADDKL